MRYYIRMRNNELYHYGVKGMKWGVRKEDIDEYITTSRTLNDRAKRAQYAAGGHYTKYNRDTAAYQKKYRAATSESERNRLKQEKKKYDEEWFKKDAELTKRSDEASEHRNKYIDETRQKLFGTPEYKTDIAKARKLYAKAYQAYHWGPATKEWAKYDKALARLTEKMVDGYGDLKVESLPKENITYSKWVEKELNSIIETNQLR